MPGDFLLLESGDALLLEDGDNLLLQTHVPSTAIDEIFIAGDRIVGGQAIEIETKPITEDFQKFNGGV